MASVDSIPIANNNQQAVIRSSFTSKANSSNTAPSINSILKHASELGITMSYTEAQLIAAGVSSFTQLEEESESIALNSAIDNSTIDTNLTPAFNAHTRMPATRRNSTGFNISALTLDTNLMDPLTPNQQLTVGGSKESINARACMQSDLPFATTRRGSIAEEESRLDTHLETTQESTGQSAITANNSIDTQSEVAPPTTTTLQKITNSDVSSLPNFYPRGIGEDDDASSMSKYSHCSSANVSTDNYSIASLSHYTIQSQYSKVSNARRSRQSVRRRDMYNSTLNENDLSIAEYNTKKSEANTNKLEEESADNNMERSEPMLSIANSEETPSSSEGVTTTIESYEKKSENYNEKNDTDLLLNEAANVLKEKIRKLSGEKLGMDCQQQHGEDEQIVLCQEIKPTSTSASTKEDVDGQSEAASTNYYESGTQGSSSLHNGMSLNEDDLNNSKALVLLDESNHQSYGQSGVTDESPTSVTETASLDNDTTSNHQHSQALVLHSSEQQHQERQGIEPTEIIYNKAFLHIDGPNDPPGESPNDCPVVCLDIIPHTTNTNSRGERGWEASVDAPSAYSGRSNDSGRSSDPGGGSYHSGDSGINDNGRGRRWSNVTWVDPKTIQNENDIDYNVLRQYETLTGCNDSGAEENSGSPGSYEGGEESRALVVAVDPPSATTTDYSSPTTTSSSQTPSSIILSNPRTRIATISSGYKKANYFVREDLDTRIYFHQIEDAIGYMAKRGYCKMRGEEEKEWKILLGKAHGVIKGGAKKKEKQRYRKGKLVMILKKTITDTPAAADLYVDTVTKPKKETRKKKNKKARSSSSTMSSSQDTQSTATECSSSLYSSQSTDTSVQTSRTSLGKTIRGTYKSYSEKFLAQQEEEKQRCLLAIMEGVPADELNVYGNNNVVGKQLLLTDGSYHYDGPVDAPSEYGDETTTSGASTYNSSHTASKDDFKKSSHTAASNRRGVYGGGVTYFTPDNGKYDDDESETEDEDTEQQEEEDCSDDDDFEEENVEEYTSQDEYEEDDTEEEGENDTIELEASDNSMFSSEDSYDHHQNSVGVESISDSTMSTAKQNERRHYNGGKKSVGSGKRRGGKGRGPPEEMTTISDNSFSTSNS